MKFLGALVTLLSILFAVFLVLFLGGLSSAWWEIRKEKALGLTPTRPADDLRAKRKARAGGLAVTFRIWWRGVRTGIPQCWCGVGTLVAYPALPPNLVEGIGCTAVEAGHPGAYEIHARAGTYQRTPAAEAVAS